MVMTLEDSSDAKRNVILHARVSRAEPTPRHIHMQTSASGILLPVPSPSGETPSAVLVTYLCRPSTFDLVTF